MTVEAQTRARDLAGQVYGRLTALSYAGSYKSQGAVWSCRCSCGGLTEVKASSLVSGKTRSCGCLNLEVTSARITAMSLKHGSAKRGYHTPEYAAWRSMRDRCGSDVNYLTVTICPEWEDFSVFLSDMGPCPPGRTLDRVDSAGNYQPGNCRWATTLEQQNNRGNNVIVEHGGRSMTVAEWARDIGMPYRSLYTRLFQLKWPVDRALTAPPRGVAS